MWPCPVCGADPDAVGRGELGPHLVEQAGRLALRLTEHPVGYLRAHPVEGQWSALAYGCHVRDLLILQRERVTRALVDERPTFAGMDPDRRAVDGRYDEADPDTVAAALVAAAEGLADVLAGLDADGWARSTVYPSPPPPTDRDLDWIARNTVHELAHHLADVDRLLDLTLGTG